MPTPFSQTVGAFYDAWAEEVPDPGLQFLNYGLEDPQALGTAWIAPGDEPYRLHLNLIRHLLHGVDLEGKVVLEVSSGRGGNCRYLASYTGARDVLGIDRCAANVRLARRAIADHGVAFSVGDAEDLCVGSGSMDVVVNLEAAHCYGRFSRFLSEVRRVLRPGGVFCFADLWGLALPGVDWARREEELAGAGFEVTRAEDIGRGVLRALELETEGIFHRHDPGSGSDASQLGRRVVAVARELRNQLAAGMCSYRLLHLTKPRETHVP